MLQMPMGVAMMSKNLARLALVFAVLGLMASAAAAYTHYRLLTDQSYLSFCDVSATVSCSGAYTSRFGSVGGVPVAVFGLLWFAAATLLASAGVWARPTVQETVPAYLFVGSTLALSVVLYLAYASFFLLNVVCMFCLLTYVAVIGLFLVSGASTKVPILSLPGRTTSDLKVLASSPLAVALTALLVGGALSTLMLFPREGSRLVAAAEAATPEGAQTQNADFRRWYEAQTRVSLVIPSDGAKVLIVKFNDFQCPACGQSYRDYKAVLARYASERPGEVRAVLKDFPLDAECNSNVSTTIHPAACEAAVAMRLVDPSRALELEDWLYSNQPSMTPESVREAARRVGHVEDFDARYEITLEAVKADTAYGRQLGIRSTPTFFINGTKIEGSLPAQFFDEAIAYELERAASP